MENKEGRRKTQMYWNRFVEIFRGVRSDRIKNEAEERACMLFGEAVEEDIFESRYLDSDDMDFRSDVSEDEMGAISRLS